MSEAKNEMKIEAKIEMLAVPGARLYTEARGAGPLLLCIVGGNGDAEVFAQMAARLASQFTVVSYERRGFARSPIVGPPAGSIDGPIAAPIDDAARIAVDADDARRVIEAYGGGPAYVLGSSSGAICGLALLARAPDAVRMLIAHEPPMVTLLPDAAAWIARFEQVHETYVAEGVAAGLAEFGAAVGLPGLRPPPPGAHLAMHVPPAMAGMLERMPANQAFMLEHELRTYPRFAPDVEALRAAARKLMFGIGRDTPDGVLSQPARRLARSVGAPVVEFAGGHVGYMTHPAVFAAELAALLVPDRRAA